MIALLGIDCATNPKKTGLALGELRGEVVHILRCSTGASDKAPAAIAVNWLDEYEEALIALDAPLGWPQKLGVCLSTHRAGLLVQAEANQLFRRMTDVAIKDRLGKQPLEVGANLIARTAVAALMLLDQIRRSTGRHIPLAWAPKETERWRAIEVYPAATRIGYGAPDIGGSLEGLEESLDCSAVLPALARSKDAVDAAVCALAAADFLSGRAAPPQDHDMASVEGWIWAPRSCPTGRTTGPLGYASRTSRST
jgi:predicted nuclease with RNAse H fold